MKRPSIFSLFALAVLALVNPRTANAQCMKWMPNDTPLPGAYCEWCWQRVGIGQWMCPCPDGSWANLEMRNGNMVSVCPGQGGYAPPMRNAYTPPPPGRMDAPRTCMSGREMFGYIAGNTIIARSLRSGNSWSGYFGTNGVVRFSYESGGSEVNGWKVVGYAILLRKGGRTIARRKICRGENGELYWVDYDRKKRTSLILDSYPGQTEPVE